MKPFNRPDTSLIMAHLLLWGLFLFPSVPYYFDRMAVSRAWLAVGFSWFYFGLPVYINQFYFLPRFFYTSRRLTCLLLTFGLATVYWRFFSGSHRGSVKIRLLLSGSLIIQA